MKKYFFLFFIALAMILGCSKDGEQGPKGDKGDKGDQGAQGITGTKGADGTVIFNGTTAPTSSIGKLGDYYMNLSSKELYGPKSENGWGNPTSLKGDKGDDGINGKDGSSLLGGNGAPTMNIGKPGDFYLDLNTLSIHGPRNASDWGGVFPLASNQKNGVNVYLIRNVRFTLPSNDHLDFINTKPWFYYKSKEIMMGNVNIKKGLYFMYWRYNSPSGNNDVRVDNYFDHTWHEMVVNGNKEYINVNSNQIEIRLEQNRVGRNPIMGVYVLQPELIGKATNEFGASMDPHEFYNFRESATFDILIKHIPESSATQIQARGGDIQEFLKINSK